MKYNLFQSTFMLLCLALFPAVACKKPVNPCIQSLQQRDQTLGQHTDSLILRRGEMTLAPYRAALEQLHTEEKKLFSEVENCDFGKNLQAWNYWYRGRLKFPGKIEQEMKRLERDSVGK
jgi:hypothetical protein